jgi:hypothetical protein
VAADRERIGRDLGAGAGTLVALEQRAWQRREAGVETVDRRTLPVRIAVTALAPVRRHRGPG